MNENIPLVHASAITWHGSQNFASVLLRLLLIARGQNFKTINRNSINCKKLKNQPYGRPTNID